MRRLLLLLVLLLSGAVPEAALAEKLSLVVEPEEGAVYGEELVLRGVLTANGVPVGGERVVLESRSADGTRYVRLQTATTGRDGGYQMVRALGRNARLRVSADRPGARTSATAYVFPRARLVVQTVTRNVVQITQTLTGPSSAQIVGTTRFYLGPRGAATARLAGSVRVGRTRSGRARAQVRLRVPARYDGRFSFAACFDARGTSTMGDPSVDCPTRSFAF